MFQIGGADVHGRCTYVRMSAKHSLPAQTHGARCPSPSGLAFFAMMSAPRHERDVLIRHLSH